MFNLFHHLMHIGLLNFATISNQDGPAHVFKVTFLLVRMRMTTAFAPSGFKTSSRRSVCTSRQFKTDMSVNLVATFNNISSFIARFHIISPSESPVAHHCTNQVTKEAWPGAPLSHRYYELTSVSPNTQNKFTIFRCSASVR